MEGLTAVYEASGEKGTMWQITIYLFIYLFRFQPPN